MTANLSGHHHRLTSDDLMRMTEVGILREGDPVELLAGQLVVREPQSPYHAALTEHLRRLFEREAGAGFHVRTHAPLDLGPHDQPEPDVALVRGPVGRFAERHPGGRDVMLVVEVAVASRALDAKKADAYARAGIPVYWIVDVRSRRIEVYDEPRPDGGWARRRVVSGDDSVALPNSGNAISVERLLKVD